MDKKIVGVFGLSLFVVILISNVLAITGSIGNARMVLRAGVGDKIEKYVLVKNVNNVSVDIKISASGDLEKYVEIKDEEFTLPAGEEKKAYFTIKATKEGTTETKINVQFMPQEGKNGVGLSSTVIVIAGEGLSDETDEEENEINSNNNINNTGVNVATGKAIDKSGKTNYAVVALSITGVIFLIFIVLLIIAYKKTKNRGKIKYKKRSGKR